MLRRCLSIAGFLALVSSVGLAQERGTAAPPKAPEIAAVADARTPVALSDVERAFIRREMREFLASLQETLEASATGDHARAAASASRVGMNGPEKDHIPKSLAPKLPLEFKQLGLATHRGFDRIADEAKRRGSADHAPKQIGELMQNCVACHGTWRIVGEAGK